MSNESQSPDHHPPPAALPVTRVPASTDSPVPDVPDESAARMDRDADPQPDLILEIDRHLDLVDKSNRRRQRVAADVEADSHVSSDLQSRTPEHEPVSRLRQESETPVEDVISDVDLTPLSRTPSTDESQLLDRTTSSDVMGGLASYEDHYGFAPDAQFHDVDFSDNESNAFNERLQEMEEEQEQLNSSLIALTSHFAQVQLRLKQIVDADSDEKERLLKELEEFAFRGIPDTRSACILDVQQELTSIRNQTQDDLDDKDPDDRALRLDRQRDKQKELMCRLKRQLEDLEQYAYETGDRNVMPSSMLIERQTVIIEQLKGKLSLNLDEMDRLTPEELRKQVDQALRDLINPVLMKEQLVEQLKTQVTDLERFIEYLQASGGTSVSKGKCTRTDGRCTCDCPLHGNSQTGVDTYNDVIAGQRMRQARRGEEDSAADSEEAIKMIKRVMTLLNMITLAQFGCNRSRGKKKFERNILKKTSKGSHWGDLRARLELAIDRLLTMTKEVTSKASNDSDYTSDSDDNTFIPPSNEKITSVVRKELALSLRDLMQHGLVDFESESSHGTSVIVSHILDWGCFPTRSSQVTEDCSRRMTAWDLILKYYETKEGDRFKAAPARQLSQSFNLQIVGGTAITPKQTLLTAIADIIESHTPFKRSPESHFKAFVSRALNEGKLATWIRLIVKNRKSLENYYEPWSYAASTGFDDALRSLEKLTTIKFEIPTDLSVRQLSSITEAF